MKYSKLFIVSLFVLVSFRSMAQRDLTTHFLNTVVQSDYTNPAFIPQGTFSTGIPFFTSTQFSFINSGFVIEDIRADSIGNMDFDYLLDKMSEKNFTSIDLQMDLLTARFKIKNLFFGLNFTDKMSMRLGYAKDLMQFVVKGNSAFLGKTAKFEGTAFDASYYHELGGSAAYKLGKFTLGIRLKYLRGVANINTEKSTFNFYTNPDNYNLSFSSDILVNASGLSSFDKNFSLGNFLTGKGNNGFASDLGATFKLNEKFTFSASMVDMGFINWNNTPKNYLANNTTYTYDGIKLNSFAKSGDMNFDTAIDSMKSVFKTDETKNPYTTSLIAKSYISAIYTLTQKNQFGALIYTEYYKTMQPAVTLSYIGTYSKDFQLALTYSAMQGSYNNIGLGWAWNVGAIQLYSSYDNILALFMLEKAKLFNIRFGVNMVFGRKVE